MKELISLDGNGNKFRIIRGNDGDIHLGFDCPEKGVFLESVRVGVGNSGGQEVPAFVKRALIHLFDTMRRWEEIDGRHCGECDWLHKNRNGVVRCCSPMREPRAYAEMEACEMFDEKKQEATHLV